MPAKSYEELMQGLKRGPRVKSEATKDLEKIARAFLDPNQEVSCRYNALNELQVTIDEVPYNLTLILKNYPDFEHLEFGDEIDQYEDFIRDHASAKPNLRKTVSSTKEKKIIFPTREDYAAIDPNGIHSNLRYAEKLAITLYTGDNYKYINDFLRKQGQLDEWKSYDQQKLRENVKEWLLASCIAAHGLKKINIENEVIQKLFRVEDIVVTEINKQRQNAIQNNKPISLLGLTSTSYSDHLVTKLKEDLKDDTKQAGTVIEYIQPIAINPLGKSVELLSQWDKEKEVLFPPNTQFIYYDYELEKIMYTSDLHHFQAVPIRSIQDLKPSSYLSRNATLREEVIDFCSKHQSPLVNNEALLTLKRIIEAYALSNPNNNINDVINRINQLLLNKKLWDINKDLLPHIEYVYKQHLRHPYKSSNPIDAVYTTTTGEEIFRPNHGLAHSVRVALYLPAVIDYFSKHAKDENFRKFCQSLDKAKLKELQIALLFFVSGRESEVGFQDDKIAYDSYKKARYENFAVYAKTHLKMSEAQIKQYEPGFLAAQQYYDGTGKDQTENQYQFNIMLFTHKLDLMRCCNLKDFIKAVDDMDDLLIEKSQDQQMHKNNLFNLAYEMSIAHGDRMMTCFENDNLISKTIPYNETLFLPASKDLEACLDLCLKVETIVNPLQHSITPVLTSAITETELEVGLHEAAKNGYLELVKLYLEKGVNLNQFVNGYTPLHIAALNGHANIINLLIAKGANINQLNTEGMSALHLAAYAGHSKTLTTLLSQQADPALQESGIGYKTPLHRAIEGGHADTVIALLTSQTKIPVDPNAVDADGATPLHIAVKNANIPLIKILLEHGANLFKMDNNQLTPLDIAVSLERADLINALSTDKYYQQILQNLTKQSNPFLKSTLLFSAISRNDISSIQSLVQLDVDINKVDPQINLAPLHFAAQTANRVTLETLIAIKNCDINIKDKIGMTPLHYAILSANFENTKLLLKNNADIFVNNNDEISPFDLALASSDVSYLKSIIHNNIDLTLYKNGNPFVQALLYGHPSVIKVLLEHFKSHPLLDLNAMLNLSINYNLNNITSLILEHGATSSPHFKEGSEVNQTTALTKHIDDLIYFLDKKNEITANSFQNTTQVKQVNSYKTFIKACTELMPEIDKLVNHSQNLIFKQTLLETAFRMDETSIIRLLKANSPSIIKMLIQKIQSHPLFDINTLLDITINNSLYEVISILLEHGADPNHTMENDSTWLHKAASTGNVALTKLLITHHAVILTDASQQTPLDCAVKAGHADIIEVLVQNLHADLSVIIKTLDPNPDKEKLAKQTLLEAAVLLNDKDNIDELLKLGARPDNTNNKGKTPLEMAVIKNHPYLIKALLQQGTDLDDLNTDNHLLFLTAQYGSDKIIKLLHEKGANLNAKNSDGLTCMHIAFQHNQTKTMNTLADLGAKIDKKDNQGLTPLHHIGPYTKVATIETLISLGTNINAVDDYERTPLYYAIDNNQIEAVKDLVMFGAEIITHNDLKLIELAFTKNPHDIFKVLLLHDKCPPIKGELIHHLIDDTLQENDWSSAICILLATKNLDKIPNETQSNIEKNIVPLASAFIEIFESSSINDPLSLIKKIKNYDSLFDAVLKNACDQQNWNLVIDMLLKAEKDKSALIDKKSIGLLIECYSENVSQMFDQRERKNYLKKIESKYNALGMLFNNIYREEMSVNAFKLFSQPHNNPMKISEMILAKFDSSSESKQFKKK